jgi:hypothetical protein
MSVHKRGVAELAREDDAALFEVVEQNGRAVAAVVGLTRDFLQVPSRRCRSNLVFLRTYQSSERTCTSFTRTVGV